MSKRPTTSPATRRYNTDLLVYEAFYVALRNALIVALAPLGVFLFLAAVEEFRMTEGFLSTLVTMTEIAFAIAFFINFLYYVYFIKLRRLYACLLSVGISVGLAVAIFFSELQNILSNTQQAVIMVTWLFLLAIIMIVNKIGHGPDKETQYEHESWLYRHALAEAPPEEEERGDPEDRYMHRYVERPEHTADEHTTDEDDPSVR